MLWVVPEFKSNRILTLEQECPPPPAVYFSAIQQPVLIFACSPITYAWEGGCLMAQDPDFENMVLTRQDYEEQGLSYALEQFDVW